MAAAMRLASISQLCSAIHLPFWDVAWGAAIPPLAINPASSGRLGYSRAQPTAAFPGPAPAFPLPLLPPARLLNALYGWLPGWARGGGLCYMGIARRAFPPRSINPASSGRLGYSRAPPIAAFPGPAPAFPLPLLPPARLLNAGWCRWMVGWLPSSTAARNDGGCLVGRGAAGFATWRSLGELDSGPWRVQITGIRTPS
ncbi:hypothetical protein B0H14DRAFT_2565047 [Mycena olivaceomarginata]|nr:hypothetical protein B0H14DRAFT_2565047 [Mycena olivaceomarginata]